MQKPSPTKNQDSIQSHSATTARTETKRLRLLIADDHATVREGLKLIIGSQVDIEVVGEADNGRMAIDEAVRLRPDIVLMDISMPKLNGLKATQKLKECCPEVKVLALTRYKDDGYLRQLLRAGASGYVLKQSPSSELLHAIRSIAEGGKYLDPAVAGKVMGSYAGRDVPNNQRGETLTQREEQILSLIALGHSNKEIAGQLDLSVKTVEVHKANAMRKLDMQSRIDIVRYAIFRGWMEDG